MCQVDVVKILPRNCCVSQRQNIGSGQGWQICLQSGSDWPQMGQIRGFFRSDFSAFGAESPNALKSDLKKSRICPIWDHSDPLWRQIYHPCPDWCSLTVSYLLSLHLLTVQGCQAGCNQCQISQIYYTFIRFGKYSFLKLNLTLKNNNQQMVDTSWLCRPTDRHGIFSKLQITPVLYPTWHPQFVRPGISAGVR